MHSNRIAAAAVSIGLLSASASAGPVYPLYDHSSFANRVPPEDGGGVLLPTIGDLDHDGVPDLIVSMRGESALVIHYSAGRGVWGGASAVATLPEGYRILDMIPVDADGDAETDIAFWGEAADGATAFFGAFLNDGNGGFAIGPLTEASNTLAIAFESRQFDTLAAGDVDGDGIDDLVIAADALVVLAGDGAGGFGAPGTIGDSAHAVETADIDGDGTDEIIRNDRGDLAIERFADGAWQRAGSRTIYLGTPGFYAIAASALPGGEAGTRVVFSPGLSDAFLTSVSEDFEIAEPAQTPATVFNNSDFLLTDLVGEEAPDVITATGVLMRDVVPGGGFPDASLYIGLQATSIAAHDIDLDGDRDLIRGSRNGIRVDRIESGPAGREISLPVTYLSPDFSPEGEAYATAIGDFDGDGLKDICTLGDDDFTVLVHYQEPDGSFTPVRVPDRARSGRVLVADFDGDGLDDLAIPTNGDHIQFSFAEPGRTFADPVGTPAGGVPRDAAAADIDNDGMLDVFTQTQYGYGVVRQTSPRVFELVHAAGGTPARLGIAAGDLNGDGYPDLVFGGSGGSGDTRIYFYTVLANGDGTYAEPVPTYFDSLPEMFTLFDFDADGDLDLASAGVSEDVPVFENDGHGGFTVRQLLPGASRFALIPGVQAVNTADLNGDGINDLLLSDAYGGTTLHLGSVGGDRWFDDSGTMGSSQNLVNQIAVDDIDGDGRPDIVTPAYETIDGFVVTRDMGFHLFTNLTTPQLACPPDLAPPHGVLDLADIVAFVTAFSNQDAAADLGAPFGVFDLSDLNAFVGNFAGGCE